MNGPSALGSSALPPSPLTESTRPADAKKLTDTLTPSNRMAAVDRTKVDPKALAAAQGMEGMFLDYMMKVMRSTVPKNDMDLSNTGTEVYQGMLDQEYAQKAVHAGGVGLADQILAYMESQRYTQPQGSAGRGAPMTAAKAQVTAHVTSDTGGIHEGQ